MTFEQRVQAVSSFGFTDRQSKFLVTVLTHSGVCIGRQYCEYAGISYGEPSRALFRKLDGGGYATFVTCAHGRTRLYHIHHKPLYAAIGEPENRLRRPTSLARAVERLMVLDAVTMDRALTWFGTERDKVSYFTTRAGVPRDYLPAATFKSPDAESDSVPAETVRYFPERLPIGVSTNGPTHVFLYLAADPHPTSFRMFLERHADLMRRSPRWSLRVVFPRHRTNAIARYESAFKEQLLNPLTPRMREEVEWYFTVSRRGNPALDERYFRAQSAFDQPRYRTLLRRWMERGDEALDAATSSTLQEAVESGAGRFESVVLPYGYLHLTSLVGTA